MEGVWGGRADRNVCATKDSVEVDVSAALDNFRGGDQLMSPVVQAGGELLRLF